MAYYCYTLLNSKGIMSAENAILLRMELVLVGLRLLNTSQETDNFIRATNTEVVVSPLGIIGGSTDQAKRLELQMERITVSLLPDRTNFERAYPNRDNLERLSEIVDLAAQHTENENAKPTSFGYNADLAYDLPSGQSALSYLGTRLFNKQQLDTAEWELVGGAGRLVFNSVSERWTVVTEPRFNDPETSRVYLSLNLHKAERRFPQSTEVRESFNKVWDQALNFVQHMQLDVS